MKDVNSRRLDGVTLHVFDVDPVGVAVTGGSAHRLIYVNDAYKKIVGERELGVPIREAFCDLRAEGFFTRLDRVLETGEPVNLENFAFPRADAAEAEPFAAIGISRVSLGDGEPGLLIRAVDVTEQIDIAQAIESVREEQRNLLQRFESLAGLQRQAIWVSDLQGRPKEPCPGWESHTGLRWEEYCEDGWLNAVHPDDRERTRRTWLTAVDQRLSCWEQTFRLRTRDGTYRHVRERGVPIVQGDQVVEWVGTIADVEEEWQEARRRKLLDQAAAATADLAGLEEVLHALADVIVSTLADGCGIYVLPDVQEASDSLPLTSELLVSIARTRGDPPPTGPVTFGPDSHFVRAVRTRRPVRWNFRRGEPPRGVAHHVREWMVAAEVNSLTLVPVVVDGAVAAVVAAVVCEDHEPLRAADVDLLQQMLNHAHAHLRNAMRFQRTQRVALALQHCLLPEPPRVAGLEITARYQPCATSAEIGGDWYDSFVPPCGSLLLTIGDVAGHDLTAAVTMSQVRNMLRGLAMDREESPGEILRRLNVATESLCPECVATCVLARLHASGDGWRVSYSVAGHPPPLLVTCDGEARYLAGAVNPLLGVGSDLPRTSAVAALPLHSTLLLYTDGLIEVPGEHLDSGLERLRRKAAALARVPLDDFCDGLLAGLTAVCSDDIAMIAVRVPGT